MNATKRIQLLLLLAIHCHTTESDMTKYIKIKTKRNINLIEFDCGIAEILAADRSQDVMSQLGQCKARPIKFHLVCLFFIFYFFLSITVTKPQRAMTKVHWPPMNKFVCKLHGYIVYLILRIIPSDHAQEKTHVLFVFYIATLCHTTSFQGPIGCRKFLLI